MNPSTQPDFIVVGSGLSALVFSALAVRRGAKVQVLEAHEHAGGYGHTFSLGKSAKFNAQFHYVWNCGEGETVHRVLSTLGLSDEVTFERLDPDGFDRMCLPGYDIRIPAASEELAKRLVAVSPASASAIRKFLHRVDQVARGIDLSTSIKTPGRVIEDGVAGLQTLRYLNASLQDVFDQFNLPLPIQGILASQWPDFLLPPEKLSFFAWVMLFTGYQRGAYYPTRHFEHVIESLVLAIREGGGSVELNQMVTDFRHDGKRVNGVDVIDCITGENKSYSAAAVVSNMDPRRTAEMIGMQCFPGSVQRKLNYEYSPSNFMIYCTVKGLDLETAGFGRWNTFHAGELDINSTFRRMYENHDYSNPSFAITTPGLMTHDRSDRPEGEEIIELLTVADYDYFNSLLRQDRRAYLAAKKNIMDSIFDVVEAKYIPDFRRHLSFKIAGTPTTNERFCWSPGGNSYGMNMTPRNITWGRVPCDSGMPGLYFCNASAGFPGFAGSFWNGESLCQRLVG